MDHFYEQVVIKQNKTFNDIVFVFANIVMVILGLLGFIIVQSLLYNFQILALLLGLVCIGLAVLLFLKKGELRTEFEYTFTNGEIDFAKVFNNEKRKNLGSMKVQKLDAFGKVNSENFRKFINTPGLKKRNWFLNREAELYYFYFVKENSKNIIVVEPDEMMVDYIKKYLPRGVYRD